MTVAEHLAASRDAHVRYRTLHDASRNTSTADMKDAIQTALDARLAADAADPDHTDAAWAIDVFEGKTVSHADLIAFYESYLAAH